MKNNQTVLVSRAVAATFIKTRVEKWIVIIVIIATVLAVMSSILSVSHSAWWLTPLVFILPLLLVLGIAYLLVHFISARLMPKKLSQDEKQKVGEFITTAENTIDARHAFKISPTVLGISALFAYIRGGKDRVVDEAISPLKNVVELRRRMKELNEQFRNS